MSDAFPTPFHPLTMPSPAPHHNLTPPLGISSPHQSNESKTRGFAYSGKKTLTDGRLDRQTLIRDMRTHLKTAWHLRALIAILSRVLSSFILILLNDGHFCILQRSLVTKVPLSKKIDIKFWNVRQQSSKSIASKGFVIYVLWGNEKLKLFIFQLPTWLNFKMMNGIYEFLGGKRQISRSVDLEWRTKQSYSNKQFFVCFSCM